MSLTFLSNTQYKQKGLSIFYLFSNQAIHGIMPYLRPAKNSMTAL